VVRLEIEILEENSKNMYDFIDKIINECGPRMPCSFQEEKAAQMIKREFDDICDGSKIETFTCHPRAFLGFIKIIVFLALTSFLLFFLSFQGNLSLVGQILIILSFFLNIFADIILWNEFFNYREFIDPLFKKKYSQNVIGKFNAKGESENLLIFSGHHDSALEFNLLKRFKIGYVFLILIGLLVLFLWSALSFVFLIISLIGFLIPNMLYILSLILFIISIPSFIGMLFFVSAGEKANKVPGAVDNLSAVAILVGIGQYLKKNQEFIPPNTEVRLISFGCEEAGLRGSRRYVEAHLDELVSKNAECVNMDAIQAMNNITLVDYEPSTRTHHSQRVISKLEESTSLIGENVRHSSLGGEKGISKLFGQISGGTDATSFSKAKVHSANISAMDLREMIKFYHQSTDTTDKIQKGVLEKVLRLCLAYIKV
jgi:hypothetical protein